LKRKKSKSIINTIPGEMEKQLQIEKENRLKRLLMRKGEEERNIIKAKDNWKLIRKKIKIIRMMGSFGGEFVQSKLSEKRHSKF